MKFSKYFQYLIVLMNCFKYLQLLDTIN